ncbi:DUF1961 family protein [Leekyejoonella antrihumi]|uniref:DUF1961 family protein n=1 Tax=Leekyejoonella antrihumi TaxID=1660198 RepID=A0A563DZB2_9MICO|nr:DUF1961 family protein [Leekyejoonella antrihumi]
MVAQGADPLPGVEDVGSQFYRVEMVKDFGHVELSMNGLPVLGRTDDGTAGPPVRACRFGFRQMAPLRLLSGSEDRGGLSRVRRTSRLTSRPGSRSLVRARPALHALVLAGRSVRGVCRTSPRRVARAAAARRSGCVATRGPGRGRCSRVRRPARRR